MNCPALPHYQVSGPKWTALIMTVPGNWLHELFLKYGDRLFSANYRGFLGITKRRRINTQIRSSAESQGKDFWVFNNGITLLTLNASGGKDHTRLTGVSVINGAQTTGSIGSVDTKCHSLADRSSVVSDYPMLRFDDDQRTSLNTTTRRMRSRRGISTAMTLSRIA